MSIEGIISKIQDGSDQKIDDIKKEHQSKIAKLKAELAEYERKAIEKAEDKAEIEAEKAFQQTINRSEADLRKELLAEKQKMIEMIFEKGKQAILDLDQSELRERYARILKSFDQTEGTLLVGKEDNDLLNEDFLAKAREMIGEIDYKLEVSQNFDHGLMLIAGRIQFDARLDQLYLELKERLTDDVVGILFQESEESPES